MKKHNAIVWVHGDNLSPNNPVFDVYEDAPALFVWDHTLLDRWHVSLKRITFIYESLFELPVDIRQGNVVDELVKYAREHGVNRIAMVPSRSPRFQKICRELEKKGFLLDILQTTAFTNYDKSFDLRRLSRYWSDAKSYAYAQ